MWKYRSVEVKYEEYVLHPIGSLEWEFLVKDKYNFFFSAIK